MKSTIVFLASLTLAVSAWAQPPFEIKRIDTPPQSDAIPLYKPGDIPEGKVVERWTLGSGNEGEKPSRRVRNVTWPTITPTLPGKDKATGLAVIVAPGGAYVHLAIDKEGYDIASLLVEQGIAAFVLKYRVNETPDDEQEFMKHMAKMMSRERTPAGDPAEIKEPRAAVDALAALSLVRSRAGEWGIDPERVGMIGFSAGAMTGLQSVMTGSPDQQPDFLGYIYGPMKSVAVPENAPPMFVAFAMDDPLFAGQGFGIVEAWQAMDIPVELHAYERGSHGFGAGRTGTTSTGVISQFILWLESRGLMNAD